MARRRMVDPNIWSSEDFNRLSRFARLLFIGMFSNADDEGRGRAKPNYLKSIICPYDADVTPEMIAAGLEEIAANVSVEFYSVGQNDYYQILNWHKWQKVDRPTPSKIPANTKIDECSSSPRRSLDSQRKGKERNIKEKKGKERAREDAPPPAPFSSGSFSNVILTVEQIEKIYAAYERPSELIDKVSEYLANASRSYANHYALLCKIARGDGWPKRKKQIAPEPDEPFRGVPCPDEVKAKMEGLFRL